MKKPTVLIAGCGYLGTALGKQLAAEGHRVWGLRRDVEALKESGEIEPFSADLLSPESLKGLPQAEIVVCCQAPSRPADHYRGTYLEGTRHLLSALAGRGVKTLIFISSTGVYGRAERAQILLETEQAVLSSGIPAILFRLGGLYGPRRNRVRSLKEGKSVASFSDATMNRIHVEDAVSGIRLLMEKGERGEIYLGVDDRPSTQKEFYGWIYEKLCLELPAVSAPAQAEHGSDKRYSNQKMKALGWQLKYPTFKEGYAALLAEAGSRRAG